MEALELTDYGGPASLRLAERPLPDQGSDRVLVDVKAIGINFPDLLCISGQYQYQPDPPFVPGCELAGVVRWAPPGSGWSVGDLVAAFVWDGSYAEVAAVPLNSIVEMASGASFVEAAAMIVNYQTVYFALQRRGHLAAGETVLILGASGGIGTAAVQVARGLGARVIAGIAAEFQRETATAAGADEVLVLERGYSSAVRELTGGNGVDVVLDPVGDWLFEEGIRALAPEGRILVVGFAAGEIPTIKTNRLLLRNVAAVGVAYGAFLDVEPSLMREVGVALNTLFDSGELKPQIGSTIEFARIPEALDELSQGRIRGKAVALGPGME